jgi:hypothetical protein
VLDLAGHGPKRQCSSTIYDWMNWARRSTGAEMAWHFSTNARPDKGLAEAAVIIEREFTTTMVHQGYIEPQNATALYNPRSTTVVQHAGSWGGPVPDLAGTGLKIRVIPRRSVVGSVGRLVFTWSQLQLCSRRRAGTGL